MIAADLSGKDAFGTMKRPFYERYNMIPGSDCMAKEMIWKEEDVEFTDWANGGAALGRLSDGRVVFVKGVLPGEKARVRYPDREARFISAKPVRLLHVSPMRIEPRCPLYGKCTVCCMQNLEYPDQLHAKREILVDHLTRISGIKDAENLVPLMLPAPSEWNYARNLSLWLDDEGSFCLPDESGNPLRLEAYCPITAECLNDVLVSMTFEPGSGIGEVEFRAGDDDDIQMILKGETDKPEDEMENDTEISVVYQGPGASYVMAGVSTLCQTAAGVPVCASDTSPFINFPGMLDRLCEKLLPKLEGIEEVSLLDVRCGTGFWSRWFGMRCRDVSALMEDESLCEDFVYNLDELENISLYIGRFAEILPGIPVPAKEWVLIEGDSSGMNEEDMAALCARNPERILCLYTDAAILARDIKRLTALGRRISVMIPFDPAPQTAAVGCAVILE